MRFRANPNLQAELEREAQFQAGLAANAQSAAAEARGLAHRIMPKNRGQDIVVEEDDGQVVIVNHDYGSHLDEFGSKQNPTYAPLRRGARTAGLKFRSQ
jgi:hypothetical protein